MSFFHRIVIAVLFSTVLVSAQSNTSNSFTPRWWAKYQTLLQNGAGGAAGIIGSAPLVGTNVDVSNECGPQSETFITLNTRNANSKRVARMKSSGIRCAAIRPRMVGPPGPASICRFLPQ